MIITQKALSFEQFHEQIQSSSKFLQETTWYNLFIPHLITSKTLSSNHFVSGLGTNIIWKLFLEDNKDHLIGMYPIEYV